MDIDLSGRTAFISGSTQGIGRAIATTLAACGAQVTINGRDDAKVRAVAEELGVEGVAADVSTADGARAVLNALPRVDILVNNLGIFEPAPVLEIDDATWQRFWDVNVMWAIRLTRGYLPGMVERGWGRVQFMASDSAVVIAGPTHTEGVEDFVHSLVGSDLEWDEAQRRFVAEHRPNSLLGRLIEPAEIANLVAYLSSDLASATTGGAVRVDGGYVDHILP